MRPPWPPLFVGFLGTTGPSDFPPAFIAVLLHSDSRRGPRLHLARGHRRDLPVPVRGVYERAWGLRPRGARPHLAIAAWKVLPSACRNNLGAPKVQCFRGSIPSPSAPLPTLPMRRRRHTDTARGRFGSLLPHRMALSSTTPRQFSGASATTSVVPSGTIAYGGGRGLAVVAPKEPLTGSQPGCEIGVCPPRGRAR